MLLSNGSYNVGKKGRLHNSQTFNSNSSLVEMYFQEIIPRRLIRSEGAGVTYEVLFRPKKICTSVESFYANIKPQELLDLTRFQIEQLTAINYKDIDVVSLTGNNIERLFVNIEPRVIFALEKELLFLNSYLKELDVELVIEITERLSSFGAGSIFNCIAKMHDFGVKFAIDDFEPSGDFRKNWLNSGYIDLVKLIIPHDFDKSEKIRLNFTESVYQLKNTAQLMVVIEKVETIEQVLTMDLVVYDFLQGYFFSHPEKFNRIVLGS